MQQGISHRAEQARSAAREELLALVHDPSEEVLAALLSNPQFDEPHLLILLERKDLPRSILATVARRKDWMRSYPVKLGVVSHPHTARLLAISLIRQLYLFDLARVSLLPSVPAELRRLAEEQILGRLSQLPLGQKFTLARRGSARVAAALLAEGFEPVIPLALDNAFLNEAQVLHVLSRTELSPGVVEAVSRHRKWSSLYNVRMALVRHPMTPLARLLAFLPDLTLRDLVELSATGTLSAGLRQYMVHEIARRSARRRGAAGL